MPVSSLVSQLARERLDAIQRAANEQHRAGEQDLARWRASPVAFAHECLGIELVWSRQAELLQAAAECDRVACRAGRKVSKSHTAAVLALWWPIRFDDGRVTITAPTAEHVRDVLWAEVRSLAGRSRIAYPPVLTPGLGISWPDGRCIKGFSTDKPEAAAGRSGAHQLVIVDEASGVDAGKLEAMLGNLAGGGTLLLISNPTQPAGFFFDVFHDRREHWRTLHVSALESPNVVAGSEVIPGLARREWVAEMRDAWTETGAAYQVHVLGEFPTSADDTAIGLALVEAAQAAHAGSEATGPLCIGIDVARMGDDESVLVARRGLRVLEIAALRKADGPTLANRALAMVRNYGPSSTGVTIAIDEIGVGSSPVDFLRQALTEFPYVTVMPVNVAEAAQDEEKYHNLRTEVWFRLAEWLREGGTIPDDQRLAAELVAPRYAFDARGRLQLEPKEKTKARLRRSPDRADALALCVHASSGAPLARPRRASFDGGMRFGMSPGRGF